MTSVWAGITAAVWALFEVCLLVRDRVRAKGRTDHDAGTRMIIRLVIYATFILGIVASYKVPALAMPVSAGLSRRGAVDVAGADHPRVGSRLARPSVPHDRRGRRRANGRHEWPVPMGPPSRLHRLADLPRRVRTVARQLVVARRSSWSLPTMAVLWRIKVEEAELTRVLGDRYNIYRIGTKRLIPGVW